MTELWFIVAAQAATDPDRFNSFLLLGYGVMWLVGAVYVITLVNRQRNVRQDLELLKRLLSEEDASGEGESGDVD